MNAILSLIYPAGETLASLITRYPAQAVASLGIFVAMLYLWVAISASHAFFRRPGRG